MESKTGDSKYIIIDGKLANASTRKIIPEDEPVFIFRAKDILAYGALLHYAGTCIDKEYKNAVLKRANEFNTFAIENSERMDYPDTDD